MLMPSIFGEDMFDEFMRGFPFFDNSAENNVEKKLYGHNAKNVMKTDIKELEGGYELEIDLPGFTKEEVTAELPLRDLIRMSRRKKPVSISAVNVMPVRASVPSTLVKM